MILAALLGAGYSSDAPAGKKRWTVRLLAEKMVELKMVPSVSPMTVCNTL